VRALLYKGAMSAIGHSKEIKEYYDRKISQGKHEMLVRNNICNKLIHRVSSCVHRQEKYSDRRSERFLYAISCMNHRNPTVPDPVLVRQTGQQKSQTSLFGFVKVGVEGFEPPTLCL
jgi:hypothetical protein